MESITLFNGERMPVLGIGTWRIDKGKCEDIVYKALKMGYRHIDCASVYVNEDIVGKAFKRVFQDEKSVKREEVFVTSKLWCSHFDHVEEACRQTLKDLQLEYLDLYLIHWPYSLVFTTLNLRECPSNNSPDPKAHAGVKLDENGRAMFGTVSIWEVWKKMESLVEKGLVKSIGISNFRHPMITNIWHCSRIKPAVHQYESHPLYQRKYLSDDMKKMKICVTAYSPLASEENVEKLFRSEPVTKAAEKHKKTKAQVCLKWALQRGHVVIVKCSSEERLKENMDLNDFKLDEEDMKEFESLDEGQSLIMEKALIHWGFNPFC